MAMMGVDELFVDTNILVYATGTLSPFMNCGNPLNLYCGEAFRRRSRHWTKYGLPGLTRMLEAAIAKQRRCGLMRHCIGWHRRLLTKVFS